jgi:soluble lytic murein transglycosylase-like protein
MNVEAQIRSRACICGAVAVLLTAAALPARAQIYAGRTASGAVALSSFRAAETPDVIVARDGSAPSDGASDVKRPRARLEASAQRFSRVLHDVASETDVPVGLLHAVIAVESAYDSTAVSPKGAQGLMQLMPTTARRFGVRDPFDPLDNVRGGALYLKWLLERFGGDMQLAIAGYNAGEEAVIRAGYRIPPYVETQRYVPRVLMHLKRDTRS